MTTLILALVVIFAAIVFFKYAYSRAPSASAGAPGSSNFPGAA